MGNMIPTTVQPTSKALEQSPNHDLNYALIILMAQIGDMACHGDNLKAALANAQLMKTQSVTQEADVKASEKVLGADANTDLTGLSLSDLELHQQLLSADIQTVMNKQTVVSNTQRNMGVLYQTEVAPQFNMIENDTQLGGASNRFFHNFKSKKS